MSNLLQTFVKAMLLLVVFAVWALACGGDRRSASVDTAVPEPATVLLIEDPRCLAPAKIVVTLDKYTLPVGKTTQAHATVYDSLGQVIQGCKVIWSVK